MKYTVWTKTILLAMGSVLSIATTTLPTPQTAQISAQLQIILNDEACLQVINQIKKLHDALEQTLSTELQNNNSLLERKLTTYVIKICSFSELKKIKAAKEPLTKVLLALCDASSAFIEEVMGHNQPQTEILKSLKEKALSACQKLKGMISRSMSPTSTSGTGANIAKLDTCYRFIAQDLNIVINQPNVLINKIPLSLQNLDPLKKALAQNLSDKDVATLIEFFQSSAYAKLKNHIPHIIQIIKESFSPATKTKTEGLLTESWNQTRGTLVSFAQKLQST